MGNDRHAGLTQFIVDTKMPGMTAVHAAMGFTQELPLHFATRRLWSWREEFEAEPYWQNVIGRQVAAAGGEALWQMLVGAETL